ncbi:VOC family protein [Arachidicoccus sp.]|uniref:VOC family protein n=1 Tax=Arachidicoccus sp. TaxID=1872624 RepID=UPI003D1E8952
MNKNIICWFEIHVKDIERAKKFYTTVLGTQFHDAPAPPSDNNDSFKMSMFTPPVDEGNYVSGAQIEMPGTKEGDGQCVNTMVYFPCTDCRTEESRVEATGGTVLKPKFSIGQWGFISLCIDTEGNNFGLFSME